MPLKVVEEDLYNLAKPFNPAKARVRPKRRYPYLCGFVIFKDLEDANRFITAHHGKTSLGGKNALSVRFSDGKNATKKVFMGGLAMATTADDLTKIVEDFGTILAVNVLGKKNRAPCGFVTFATGEQAAACIKALHDTPNQDGSKNFVVKLGDGAQQQDQQPKKRSANNGRNNDNRGGDSKRRRRNDGNWRGNNNGNRGNSNRYRDDSTDTDTPRDAFGNPLFGGMSDLNQMNLGFMGNAGLMANTFQVPLNGMNPLNMNAMNMNMMSQMPVLNAMAMPVQPMMDMPVQPMMDLNGQNNMTAIGMGDMQQQNQFNQQLIQEQQNQLNQQQMQLNQMQQMNQGMQQQMNVMDGNNMMQQNGMNMMDASNMMQQNVDVGNMQQMNVMQMQNDGSNMGQMQLNGNATTFVPLQHMGSIDSFCM